MSSGTAISRARMGAVSGSAAASAALWAWAAQNLPWRADAPLAIGMWVFAGAQVVTAASVWLLPARLNAIWRACAACTLGFGLICLGAVLWTARSLYVTHGALGLTVAALLLVIAVLVAAATLPLALWGLWATRKGRAGGV